jgi:hypothetical protein
MGFSDVLRTNEATSQIIEAFGEESVLDSWCDENAKSITAEALKVTSELKSFKDESGESLLSFKKGKLETSVCKNMIRACPISISDECVVTYFVGLPFREAGELDTEPWGANFYSWRASILFGCYVDSPMKPQFVPLKKIVSNNSARVLSIKPLQHNGRLLAIVEYSTRKGLCTPRVAEKLMMLVDFPVSLKKARNVLDLELSWHYTSSSGLDEKTVYTDREYRFVSQTTKLFAEIKETSWRYALEDVPGRKVIKVEGCNGDFLEYNQTEWIPKLIVDDSIQLEKFLK